MPKYRVNATTVASAYVVVEADDPEAAIEEAYNEEGFPELCAQCTGWGRAYSLELSEWEVPEKIEEAVELSEPGDDE